MALSLCYLRRYMRFLQKSDAFYLIKKHQFQFNVIFYILTIFKNNSFLKLKVATLMIKLVIL